MKDTEMNMNLRGAADIPSSFGFAAVSPYVERNLPEITEVTNGYTDYVKLGRDNRLDQFYLGLYQTSQTLASVVDASADYVLGDGLQVNGIDADEEFEAGYRNAAFDYLLYGYAVLEVRRNPLGGITSVSHVRAAYVRTNEARDTFWYSKEWKKGSGKYMVYPRFREGAKDPVSFIMVVNNAYYTYGLPRYASSAAACQAEADVAEYNLNQIANGFSAGYHIAFNSGNPNDAQREEIERMLNEKFCGSANANRVLVSFSPDAAHQPKLTKLEQEDSVSKYTELTSWARQSILTAFRASPNIIGVALENVGFNSQEYDSAFRLFSKTSVEPVQKALNRAYAKAGIEVTNLQFSIDFN